MKVPAKMAKEIGGRIRQLRQDCGMTIDQVSEFCGLSVAALYYYESGAHAPGAHALIGMSECFGVSIDWILKGDL